MEWYGCSLWLWLYDLWVIWVISCMDIWCSGGSLWGWKVNVLRIKWKIELIGIFFIKMRYWIWIIGWYMYWMFFWYDYWFFWDFEGRWGLCFIGFKLFWKLFEIYFGEFINLSVVNKRGIIGLVI